MKSVADVRDEQWGGGQWLPAGLVGSVMVNSWRHGVGLIVDGGTPGGVMGSVGSLLLDRWAGSWILWGEGNCGT